MHCLQHCRQQASSDARALARQARIGLAGGNVAHGADRVLRQALGPPKGGKRSRKDCGRAVRHAPRLAPLIVGCSKEQQARALLYDTLVLRIFLHGGADDRLSARQAVKHPYFKELRAADARQQALRRRRVHFAPAGVAYSHERWGKLTAGMQLRLSF